MVLSVFVPTTRAFAVDTVSTYGCVIGSSSSCPGDSAWQIKQATGTNTNGLYWINVNGTATQVYSIMDSAMGGGWMLAMKGSSTGTTYVFTWTGWTNSGSYSGTQGTTNEDAKFTVFDSMTANQVLAVWPGTTGNYCNNGVTISNSVCGVGAYGASITSSYGFTWAETLTAGALSAWTGASANTAPTAVCPSSYPITLLNLFKNSSRCLIRTINAAYSATDSPYNPAGNHLFSTQKDVRFFGFNYGNTNNLVRARWGFGFNENGGTPADEGSNDTTGGIGLEAIPSGDRPTCCTADSSGGGQFGAGGINSSNILKLAYQMYVRNTGASLTTANPSFTAQTGVAGGATFTIDSSTISAETVTVSDTTNPSRTLTLVQNANGSFSVSGALSGDTINVSVTYAAKSGYQGYGTFSTNITATTGASSTAISVGNVNKLINATITVNITPSAAGGNVTFYWNRRQITRCVSKPVVSGSVSCTWKPLTQGYGVLTATFIATDGIYSSSSANPVYLSVGKRTGIR